MSILDILKRALYLYRKNFALLTGIVLPGWILIIFLGSLLGKATLVNMTNVTNGIFKYALIRTGIASFSMLGITFFILLFIAASGAIAISKRMLNQEIKAGLAYKNVLTRIFPLLGSILISGVIIGFGFALPMVGIIFGALFYVQFNLVPQVVMIEGEGGIGAMRRAKSLIHEYFKKSTILMVPPLILQIILIMLISRIIELIHSSVQATMIIALLIVIVGVFTEPFKILISTLLYYDLRTTKEGYDLEIMEQELAGEI